MKNTFKILFALLFIYAGKASAQDDWATVNNPISRDSVTKGKYTLIFANLDSAFASKGADVKARMIETFFKVYPEEAKAFNKNTMLKVTFVIDPHYNGVAATAGGVVRFNPQWMLRTPTDIDVITHEVMHIVQEYGYSAGPVWLTEGIADYVRAKFGVDNPGAGWTMPAYKPTQSYTNSYRITARFFVWMEANVKHGVIKDIDGQLRAHTYTDASWKQLTGKTIDELWAAYASNPTV